MPNRGHVLFALMCLIWGATWIAIKAGITVVPPAFFAGTRFVAAGLAMLGFLLLRGDSLSVPAAELPRWAAVTLLMIVATYALLFWGARFVSSGLASILDLALTPISLLAIGVALGEDRFTPLQVAGMLVGMAGLGLLFGPKVWQPGDVEGPQLAACAAIVASALAYSLGSVLARPLLRAHAPVWVSAVTTLAGGCVLAAGALLFEDGAVAAAGFRWGTPAWAGWLFLVLFGSLVAYTIFLHLVHIWGAARAGSYAFVSPVIAVALGVAVFGERVTVLDAAGIAAMLVGAWLTLRPVPEGVPVSRRARQTAP